MGCSYLTLPEIPVPGVKVLIYWREYWAFIYQMTRRLTTKSVAISDPKPECRGFEISHVYLSSSLGAPGNITGNLTECTGSIVKACYGFVNRGRGTGFSNDLSIVICIRWPFSTVTLFLATLSPFITGLAKYRLELSQSLRIVIGWNFHRV